MLNLVLKKTNQRTNFDYENYFRFKDSKLDLKYTHDGLQFREDDEIEKIHKANQKRMR